MNRGDFGQWAISNTVCIIHCSSSSLKKKTHAYTQQLEIIPSKISFVVSTGLSIYVIRSTILKKQDGRQRNAFIYLGIGPSDGIFWARYECS